MNYKILYDKPAVRFLQKQQPEQRERIMKAIHALPELGDIKPLKGHAGTYRLRVGGFRIIYSVDHGTVTVKILEIGNRGDIYK